MSKPNILIVEDEPNVAEAIKSALSNYDFNISSTVTTGEDAIKKVEETDIDLVLMDIVLASPMPGTTAARIIWTQFNIPIIFLTGFLNESFLNKAKISEPFGYLLKPFSERELYSAIEIAIYKSKMERSRKQIISLLEIARKINQVINRVENSQELIEQVIEIFVSSKSFSGASLILFDGMRNIYASASDGIDETTKNKFEKMFVDNDRFKSAPDPDEEYKTALNDDINIQSFSLGNQNFINIRLISHPTEYGVLSLVNQTQLLTDEIISLLKSIANDIIISLRNINLEIKRKEISRTLAESEKRYREVVENATDIIFSTDLDGNFTYTNRAGIISSGFSEHELLKLNYLDLVLPEYQEKVTEFYRDQFESRKNSAYIEYPFKTKDGSIKWHGQVSGLIYSDNNISGYHCIIRDITDRKKMEEELKHRQSEMTSLLDSIPGFAFLKDKNYRYVIANQLFCDMMGYSKEEILGKTDYDLLPSGEAEIYVNEDKKVIDSGESFFEDREYLSPDGVTISIDTRKIPLKDSNGNVTSIIGLGFDITQRKVAEEAIKKYSKSLEELNQTKDKFFSIISHDLRSPFQGLLGLSSALIEEFESFSSGELKTYLTNMNASAKNLFNLIDNLLQWSRLQRGNIKLDISEVSLYEEVLYIVSLLKNNAKDKGITIINDIPEGATAFSDINALHSVLQNLVSNAIKFTNRDGEIKITSQEKDDSVEVTITDNGVGMSEKDVERLFRIDTHSSTPGTEDESGTGFGLIISKEFIELQGGKISVKSRVSEGSSFTFSLSKIGTV